MNKKLSKKLDYELLLDMYALELAHRDYKKFAWVVDAPCVKDTFKREFDSLLTEIKERLQENDERPTN